MISNVTPPAISLVKLAHSLIVKKIKPGDKVIDATLGNGHDALFLLELVKPDGKVFCFDIQLAAIELTKIKLQTTENNENLALIQASHADMPEHIPLAYHGKIKAIMFNLGYLPGGDKRIITQTESTLIALTKAGQLLSSAGIITVIAYPGHVGGNLETDCVTAWCLSLEPVQFEVRLYENQVDKPEAPKLFVIEKMR